MKERERERRACGAGTTMLHKYKFECIIDESERLPSDGSCMTNGARQNRRRRRRRRRRCGIREGAMLAHSRIEKDRELSRLLRKNYR